MKYASSACPSSASSYIFNSKAPVPLLFPFRKTAPP
ncbi:DUF1010 domain-containing protein [Pulveribacter suum]